MKLLTKEILSKLPPLYSTDGKPKKDVKVIVKFFDPSSRWTWFITEYDGEDTFFGYVYSGLDSAFDELGYFSLSELSTAKNALGLGIERDMHYGYDHTLEEIIEAKGC